MTQSQVLTGALAMVLAAIGMWLLLPRANKPGRLLGAVAAVASLLLFGSLGARMGVPAYEVGFAVLAVVTVVSAAATVTFKSPVYCALWFSLSLLGTAGLFMMQGAQFLAVATIVVYAGAILVTFLFVLMLAQPQGHDYYDRISWEGMFAATTGAVIVGFLTMTIVRVLNPQVDRDVIAAVERFKPEETGGLQAEHIRSARLVTSDEGIQMVEIELADSAPVLSPNDERRLEEHLFRSLPALQESQTSAADFRLAVTSSPNPLLARTAQDRTSNGGVLAAEHVATLGGELFSRHLIAVEVAGTLLLVALVGAIAIVNHDRPARATHAGAAGTSRPIGGD